MKTISKYFVVLIVTLMVMAGCSEAEWPVFEGDFVQIRITSESFSENGGEVSVYVGVAKAPTSDLTFDLVLTEDGVVINEDYSFPDGNTVTIKAGEHADTLRIIGVDNFDIDGERKLTISLPDIGRPFFGGVSSASVEFIDDDCPFDRSLLNGVLVGTDSRPFTGQQFTSIADFTYVSPTLLQVVDLNTPWMETYWQEEVTAAHTVDIVMDAAGTLTIAEQPLSETLYGGNPYSYTIVGSGSINTCGDIMTISYMVRNEGVNIRASNWTASYVLPKP